jgi:hypothetical protein
MKNKLIVLNLLLIIIIILSLLYLIIIPKEEYFTISEEKINEEVCKQWFTNRDKTPIKNPLSNRRIDKNGDRYKELNKLCRKYEKVDKKIINQSIQYQIILKYYIKCYMMDL